jgi:hypothetical protein
VCIQRLGHFSPMPPLPPLPPTLPPPSPPVIIFNLLFWLESVCPLRLLVVWGQRHSMVLTVESALLIIDSIKHKPKVEREWLFFVCLLVAWESTKLGLFCQTASSVNRDLISGLWVWPHFLPLVYGICLSLSGYWLIFPVVYVFSGMSLSYKVCL